MFDGELGGQIGPSTIECEYPATLIVCRAYIRAFCCSLAERVARL